MIFYVESGDCKRIIECGTKIQAAMLFMMNCHKAGVLLAVSEEPFDGVVCPSDIEFWPTEEIREKLSHRKPQSLRIATDPKESNLFDSEREMAKTVVC